MSKLANLKNEKLKDLAVYLEEIAIAGYQEMLIDELISDIKSELM